jgi:uncharacterized protein
MPSDPFIAEAMWRRIEVGLGAIERAYQVRVLLAVESGSRAWRFPSPDSDYDVRFIYAHPADVYLSIKPPRDVIECPIDGLLDVNGWDIRKALRLLVRSNAVVLEWLRSPVRYRDSDLVTAQLLAFARETSYLPAVTYHYDRLARRSFDDLVSSSGPVRFKTYCYALRPVMALLWLRLRAQPPPMDLPSLLQGIPVADHVRQAILELVDRKAAATEQGLMTRVPILDDFIADVLAEKERRFTLPDRTAALSKADALLATLVRGDAGPLNSTVGSR